jgi:hypothetical protein
MTALDELDPPSTRNKVKNSNSKAKSKKQNRINIKQSSTPQQESGIKQQKTIGLGYFARPRVYPAKGIGD